MAILDEDSRYSVAYVSVFVRPDGTWSRGGIYSEFPCEQMEKGSWAMLASFKDMESFDRAAKKARVFVKKHYPWLGVK